MASKLVTDREKLTRALIAAGITHQGDIAAGVAAALSPYLREGEHLPDVALFVDLITRWQSATLEQLVAADRAHELELGDDAAPRSRREVAAEHVREVLVDLRGAVESAYGANGLRALGLHSAVPTDPSALAMRAESVMAALLDPAVDLGPPRRRGLALDRAGFAADLADPLPALRTALDDVAREVREAEGTLQAKNAAFAESDRATVRGSGWLAATAVLAGREDLASRLRPTQPRRAASGEAARADGGEATATADGGTAAEQSTSGAPA